MYPAASAVLLICEVSFAYVQVSAAYPKSIGFWQAMLIIQAFSSSVISAFLPRPGEFQEKKKEQEAAKPDPDADYVDDDEDYGYDPVFEDDDADSSVDEDDNEPV